MKKRIIVCHKCGALYDLHYIDNVKFENKKRKPEIEKFECKNCGMVAVTYSNPEHFQEN